MGRCVLQVDGELAQRTFVKDVIEAVAVVSSLGVVVEVAGARLDPSSGGVW